MDLRSVYCWDDPLITTKWLALYAVLWYTQHLVGFIVSLIHPITDPLNYEDS